MEKYDVIVVGAGNGGLTAAAKTAKSGYKTLLLEKNNLPGGCATSLVRGRFEFEVALHQLCDDKNPKSIYSPYNIFKELGLKIPFHYEDYLFRAIVKGDSGYDVRIRSGYDSFLADMEAEVPGCSESIRRLLNLNTHFVELQDLLNNGKINLSVFRKYSDVFRAASHSFDDVMEECGVPKKAQSILSTYWSYLGVPTDDVGSLHYISMIDTFITSKPSMPYSRSFEISLALVKLIESFGGEVRFNNEVKKFIYNKKGVVSGVEVNGKRFYAKKIISNIIPNNVWNLSNRQFLPKSALKLANARKLAMSFITVYIGLDASMEELGINDYTTFIASCLDTRRQFNERKDLGLYVVNCLNKALPDASQPDTSMLFFTLPVMPGDYFENLNPEEYKQYKNDYAYKFIKDYEKTIGVDVLGHIEEIEILTPVDFANMLGTPNGCVYGYANESWDNLVTRNVLQGVDNRIKNLYFCGGHSVRGNGFPSAYGTGYATAEKVVNDLRRGK